MSKEFDFDELDKAVSSIMGADAVKSEISDENTTKTLTFSPSLKEGEKPTHAKIDEIVKKIDSDPAANDKKEVGIPSSVQEPEQSAPSVVTPFASTSVVPEVSTPPKASTVSVAPRPSNGRFMDVVHPSSDMRSSIALPELVVPERAELNAKSTVPTQQQAAPQSESKISEILTESTIDDTDIEKKADTFAETTPESQSLTPFIADAKVEKRPLGGAPVGSGAVPSPFDDDQVDIADKLVMDDTEKEETTPINSEVKKMNVGGDEQRLLNATDYDAIPTEDDVKLQQIEDAETPELTPEQSVRQVESGDTEKLNTAGSIHQQYKEKTPETTEDGAIYDVKDYHQPFVQSAKQKNGWGVVLIVLLIIIICIGLAAAAYFILGMGV